MAFKYNFLRFPDGKAKAVTLSYDDGASYDRKLLEIIDKYGLKCTFNLVGRKIDAGQPLSIDFIKENILAHGHEVATHGYLHRAQNKIRPISGIRDVLDCRIALERALGGIIRGMAFPDAKVDRLAQPEVYGRIKEYVSELDIAYARTLGDDNDRFALPDDWYHWVPTAHHDNPNVMEYIHRFVSLDVSALYSSARESRLFYLWGHAQEFEKKKNWEHLEEICQALGKKEDIWYATNIEIHDYVEAYRQLQYSADESIVYNPTLFDIWLDIDKTVYLIRSGETVKIDQ